MYHQARNIVNNCKKIFMKCQSQEKSDDLPSDMKIKKQKNNVQPIVEYLKGLYKSVNSRLIKPPRFPCLLSYHKYLVKNGKSSCFKISSRNDDKCLKYVHMSGKPRSIQLFRQPRTCYDVIHL